MLLLWGAAGPWEVIPHPPNSSTTSTAKTDIATLRAGTQKRLRSEEAARINKPTRIKIAEAKLPGEIIRCWRESGIISAMALVVCTTSVMGPPELPAGKFAGVNVKLVPAGRPLTEKPTGFEIVGSPTELTVKENVAGLPAATDCAVTPPLAAAKPKSETESVTVAVIVA